MDRYAVRSLSELYRANGWSGAYNAIERWPVKPEQSPIVRLIFL